MSQQAGLDLNAPAAAHANATGHGASIPPPLVLQEQLQQHWTRLEREHQQLQRQQQLLLHQQQQQLMPQQQQGQQGQQQGQGHAFSYTDSLLNDAATGGQMQMPMQTHTIDPHMSAAMAAAALPQLSTPGSSSSSKRTSSGSGSPSTEHPWE